ncbi:hypothetical protein [Candidatus Mycoplasma haematohominis]|uniref:hypothetical protein n=1 Tax=Candidatus Mycoplasma haematohominis TaxID=1494318 RepID=UPI001C0A6B1F|nr:hypothetical protein [Candidatus Mycoplasma haemohominis]
MSQEFEGSQKIDKAFSVEEVTENKPKALNQVCEDVYKKEKTNINSNSDENHKKLWNNLWKYCSFFGVELITVEKSTHRYTGNQYGETKKSDLVSVKDKNNNVFWDTRNSEFYADSGDKSGTTVITGIFHTEKAKNTHIKSICEDAYTKSSSDSGYVQTDVVKFCSIN